MADEEKAEDPMTAMPTCAYPHLVHESWRKQLEEELAKPYMHELREFVAAERASGVPIYPPKGKVFTAFDAVDFEDVSVVIIGQDPYHGPGQAEGLAFSVPRGIPTPPSLRNIYKELHAELGLPIPNHGHLAHWCRQGVFLLNATLTVRQGEAASHARRGWERFTDAVVDRLCSRAKPIAFLLWGRHAQDKVQRIVGLEDSKHLILKSPHPSPLSASRRFFGCGHFATVNRWLEAQGRPTIDWRVDDIKPQG